MSTATAQTTVNGVTHLLIQNLAAVLQVRHVTAHTDLDSIVAPEYDFGMRFVNQTPHHLQHQMRFLADNILRIIANQQQQQQQQQQATAAPNGGGASGAVTQLALYAEPGHDQIGTPTLCVFVKAF